MANSIFEGRNYIVATKHGKEKAIGSVLKDEFGMIPIVPEDFNTDELGTFSGEIERTLDPISAAREKCLRVLKDADCNIAIASEGSFGPHPTAYFVNANEEVLVLVDNKNQLEIVAREISTETNFSGLELNSEDDLKAFASQAKFPSHGIILRDSKGGTAAMVKGIQSQDQLLDAYKTIKSNFNSVYAETDMRAHMNPTRMQVIKKAAEKLSIKMKSLCPKCGTPGFHVVEAKPGLPCAQCGSETRSILSYIYGCKNCDHRKEVTYPLGKKNEEPMFCDFCNP